MQLVARNLEADLQGRQDVGHSRHED
jgi:hypothetical protein